MVQLMRTSMRVVEDDDSNPDDPSRVNDFPDLTSGVTVINGMITPGALIWGFEGGKYQLNYELRLRKNEPVKASP